MDGHVCLAGIVLLEITTTAWRKCKHTKRSCALGDLSKKLFFV